MISVYLPALVVAFVITVLEMTEVVALVFALGADHTTVRHGTYGAAAGTAVVAVVALLAGTALLAFPRDDLLGASAVVLAGFGVFLFRSTLKTYRRRRAGPGASGGAPPGRSSLQFAGGFSVGAIEATEVVVVLLALAAAGYGVTALIGSIAGGLALVVAALLVHDRIRRIKTTWLKLGATSVLFSFAVFWGGEAIGIGWPGADLFLLPLFVAALLIVRGSVELGLRGQAPVAPAT